MIIFIHNPGINPSNQNHRKQLRGYRGSGFLCLLVSLLRPSLLLHNNLESRYDHLWVCSIFNSRAARDIGVRCGVILIICHGKFCFGRCFFFSSQRTAPVFYHHTRPFYLRSTTTACRNSRISIRERLGLRSGSISRAAFKWRSFSEFFQLMWDQFY